MSSKACKAASAAFSFSPTPIPNGSGLVASGFEDPGYYYIQQSTIYFFHDRVEFFCTCLCLLYFLRGGLYLQVSLRVVFSSEVTLEFFCAVVVVMGACCILP